MPISFSLDNKNIIVTGASSGLGRQIAIRSAQAGANVILVGRNQDTLDETAEQCSGKAKKLFVTLMIWMHFLS